MHDFISYSIGISTMAATFGGLYIAWKAASWKINAEINAEKISANVQIECANTNIASCIKESNAEIITANEIISLLKSMAQEEARNSERHPSIQKLYNVIEQLEEMTPLDTPTIPKIHEAPTPLDYLISGMLASVFPRPGEERHPFN